MSDPSRVTGQDPLSYNSENASVEQVVPHEAKNAGVRSGNAAIKQQHRRASSEENTASKVPPAPSPTRVQMAASASSENDTLRQELAATNALLASERATRLAADQEVARLERVVSNAANSVPDSYPYSFWPALPWDGEPANQAMPPHIWKTQNATPVRREFNPHEGYRQYKTRENQYLYDEAKNRRDWYTGGLHLWPPQDERRWCGAKYLGAGTYGSVGLWVNVDGDSNIIDRMVSKESLPDRRQWEHPNEWRNKLPREIHNHRLLDSVRNGITHRSIIRHRGYRLMMRQRRYRLYLDLCTQGTLFEAMSDRWEKMAHFPAKGSTNPLPELFVWHVFKELVDACLVLQQGSLYVPVSGWKPMVHNDLHISNVFLDKRQPEDESMHSSWPRIILADFGRTFYELNVDPQAHFTERDNPKQYRIPSDDFRYPMETHHTRQRDIKITEKADVWMIGAILWSLISHRCLDEGPILENGRPAASQEFRAHEILQGRLFDVQTSYHPNLRNMVTLCLMFHPKDRPSLISLQKTLAVEVRKAEGRLKNTTNDPKLFQRHNLSEFTIGKKHRLR